MDPSLSDLYSAALSAYSTAGASWTRGRWSPSTDPGVARSAQAAAMEVITPASHTGSQNMRFVLQNVLVSANCIINETIDRLEKNREQSHS